jgi:hypothetical protein
MQVSIWFRREARVDTTVKFARLIVFLDNRADKICRTSRIVGHHLRSLLLSQRIIINGQGLPDITLRISKFKKSVLILLEA